MGAAGQASGYSLCVLRMCVRTKKSNTYFEVRRRAQLLSVLPVLRCSDNVSLVDPDTSEASATLLHRRELCHTAAAQDLGAWSIYREDRYSSPRVLVGE